MKNIILYTMDGTENASDILEHVDTANDISIFNVYERRRDKYVNTSQIVLTTTVMNTRNIKPVTELWKYILYIRYKHNISLVRSYNTEATNLYTGARSLDNEITTHHFFNDQDREIYLIHPNLFNLFGMQTFDPPRVWSKEFKEDRHYDAIPFNEFKI